MLIYTVLFNNDLYDTRGCCRQKGYLEAVVVLFMFLRGVGW